MLLLSVLLCSDDVSEETWEEVVVFSELAVLWEEVTSLLKEDSLEEEACEDELSLLTCPVELSGTVLFLYYPEPIL